MRDRGLILAGLAVFLVLITFPVWYNFAGGRAPDVPKPVLPEDKTLQCVQDTAYMKRSHMDLLMTWRDKVVRENVRTFVAPDGKTYAMSLTKTCMKCHTSKADFCDKCHNYVAVKPYCWDCHIDPDLVKTSTALQVRSSE